MDTLSALEKSWMAPLPMKYDSTLLGYKDILKATGGHGGPTLAYAQASKDLFKLKSEIAKSYKTGDAAAITDSLKQYQDWQMY